ncbi:MAG: hypothetical protein M3Z14_02415 [Candidatus Eremiobacteraeota bacterium]|nr:hypothetical protein [Candidatus Eremiobacteraeota bacterium]
MPFNEGQFRDFVAQVGAFYITDKAMRKAHDRIQAAIKNGSSIDDNEIRVYLRAVQHYFSGFEREARQQLRTVDRQLERINQVEFNLTAERSVAVRRIEATQRVLSDLSAIEKCD